MIGLSYCLLALPVCLSLIAQEWPGVNYWPCFFRANRLSGAIRRDFLLTQARRLVKRFGRSLSALLLAAGHPAWPTVPAEPSLPVQLVVQGLYCGHEGVRVQWLDDRLAVARVLGRVRHGRTPTFRELRRLDLTRQGIVLIRMQIHPPAQPGVALPQATARVAGDVLRIRVREAFTGREQAHLSTGFCLLAAVPRGDYLAVTVVDSSGVVYGCARLPRGRKAADGDPATGSLIERATTEFRHCQ